MDASAFEQVYGAFQDFHAYFGPLFGRREARDHSRHYLQALLVQSVERRNTENLSETVPASARVMQRFLAESPWDDDAVIGRLQEYLSSRLGHPEAVWVLDGSDFPKQGRKSAGVARQYCGRLGKVANCQAGMFLAYVSPLGRALVDKRLYLPENWTSDKGRCAGGGGAGGETELPVEDRVGLGDAGAGLGARPPQGQVGCWGRRLRDVAVLPGRDWQRWGCTTCWTFPAAPRCGRWSRLGPVRSIRDSGVPANPGCETVSAGPWSSAAMNCRGMPGGR